MTLYPLTILRKQIFIILTLYLLLTLCVCVNVPVWRCAALPVSGWSVWRAAAGLQTPEGGSHAWWGGSAPVGTYDHLHHLPPEYCSLYWNVCMSKLISLIISTIRLTDVCHLHTQLQTLLLLAPQCAGGWWRLRQDKSPRSYQTGRLNLLSVALPETNHMFTHFTSMTNNKKTQQKGHIMKH